MDVENYNRINAVGIRSAADAYRAEVRQRLQAEGMNKTPARRQAELKMWEAFKPTVEKLELEVESKTPEPRLAGLPANVDSVLDSSYSEVDPGKQLRDGWLWAVLEWMRVIRDTDDGPIAALSSASTPPPNAFALFVLSTYALAGADKRRDLVSRSLSFAAKGHDTPGDADPDDQSSGFMGEL